MGKIENLPWRICNDSLHICQLMFIEEPYAGSIFIHDDYINAICRKDGEMGYVEHFEVGTNIKEVESWIKEKLELK